jgi:hypothetical protein
MTKQVRPIPGTSHSDKSAMLWMFLCGLLALVSSAHAQVVNSLQNPLQIAVLHWYPANQTTSFDIANNPQGLAFDGENIWMVDTTDERVYALRASDGALVADIDIYPVQLAPWGIAFDGTHAWVTDSAYAQGVVTRLDGASFFVGPCPTGVAFDGANMWIVNSGCTSQDPVTVTKLRASDGANLGGFLVAGVGSGGNPLGLAFDGANIWVPSGTTPGFVAKLRASDGANQGNFPVGNAPRSVAFDGANIWVGNQGDSTVTKLRASDGVFVGTFALSGPPLSLVFDGANIWVANGFQKIDKLRASDGMNVDTFFVGSLATGATAMVFDGAHVWASHVVSLVSKF